VLFASLFSKRHHPCGYSSRSPPFCSPPPFPFFCAHGPISPPRDKRGGFFPPKLLARVEIQVGFFFPTSTLSPRSACPPSSLFCWCFQDFCFSPCVILVQGVPRINRPASTELPFVPTECNCIRWTTYVPLSRILSPLCLRARLAGAILLSRGKKRP